MDFFDKFLLQLGGSGSGPFIQTTATRPRPQRRSMDKRRASGKVISREHRNLETELIRTLGGVLHDGTIGKLRKPSVLRLAVAELRLRRLFGVFARGLTARPQPTTYVQLEELLLGGFLIVLTAAGEVLYVSSTISSCLGVESHEVIGKSIYGAVHQSDWGDIKYLLSVTSPMGHLDAANPHLRSALVRLHGRSSSSHGSYCAVYVTGNMYANGAGTYFVGVGHRISHPYDNDYPYAFISSRIFTTLRCEDSPTLIRTDASIQDHLRFTPTELTRFAWFDLFHAEDAHHVKRSLNELSTKGQTLSEPFRLLAKGGGWVWVIAEASLTRTGRRGAPTALYCKYMVISGIETNDIVSLVQLPAGASNKWKYGEGSSQETLESGTNADEYLELLQLMTADVDFARLPAFVEALQDLF